MQILPLRRTAARPAFLTKAGKRGLQVFLLLLLPMFGLSARATQSVMLTWDPSPDPTVMGYNVYYGTASGGYTNIVSAGSALAITIPNIREGITYYFAVTAFDLLGQESLFSNEVSYTGVVPTSRVSLTVTQSGDVSLSGTGVAGHVYEIQATTNLIIWQVLGTQTAAANGTFTFTPPADQSPMRFFRFRDTNL